MHTLLKILTLSEEFWISLVLNYDQIMNFEVVYLYICIFFSIFNNDQQIYWYSVMVRGSLEFYFRAITICELYQRLIKQTIF